MSNTFEKINSYGHEQVVYCNDNKTGLQAIIAIHNTVLGPSLGGCRMYPYQSESEALEDVLRLSRGMTYKASISNLNLGGGKAVIIGDPKKIKTKELLESFGRFVDTLNGRYITAEDVGMTVEDMEYIRSQTNHVTGITKSLGGSGDPSIFTALGVFIGMKAALKKKYQIESFKNLKVGIQGFGKVGYYLSKHLFEAGAQIYGFDVDQERMDLVSREFGVTSISNNDLMKLELDIFSPCALGGIINPQTLENLNCQIIAGAANNQLLNEKRESETINEKKILYVPDYVINAGGLMNVANELTGYDSKKATNQVEGIYETLLEIFDLSENQNLSTIDAANLLAEKRIQDSK